MREILIIGARGFGRKVFDLISSIKSFNNNYCVKGFLDSDSCKLEGFDNYPKIISSVEDYEIKKNDVFVCALGDVIYKKYYANIIKTKGGKFINVINENFNLDSNVEIGKEGVIIFQNSIISCDSVIGDFVTLQPNVVLGHDTTIGDNCHIDSFVFTGGFSKISNNVTIHTRATILPHIEVKDNVIVGACTLVNKNVEKNKVVVGIPSKELE